MESDVSFLEAMLLALSLVVMDDFDEMEGFGDDTRAFLVDKACMWVAMWVSAFA